MELLQPGAAFKGTQGSTHITHSVLLQLSLLRKEEAFKHPGMNFSDFSQSLVRKSVSFTIAWNKHQVDFNSKRGVADLKGCSSFLQSGKVNQLYI